MLQDKSHRSCPSPSSNMLTCQVWQCITCHLSFVSSLNYSSGSSNVSGQPAASNSAIIFTARMHNVMAGHAMA
jgi:hypothetical protein